MNKPKDGCAVNSRLKVSTKIPVWINSLLFVEARSKDLTIPQVSAQFLSQGLTIFDEQTMQKSPSSLLLELQRVAEKNGTNGVVSLDIPLERQMVMRTTLRAGEYGKNVSDFAALMIIAALSSKGAC